MLNFLCITKLVQVNRDWVWWTYRQSLQTIPRLPSDEVIPQLRQRALHSSGKERQYSPSVLNVGTNLQKVTANCIFRRMLLTGVFVSPLERLLFPKIRRNTVYIPPFFSLTTSSSLSWFKPRTLVLNPGHSSSLKYVFHLLYRLWNFTAYEIMNFFMILMKFQGHLPNSTWRTSLNV